MTPAERNAAAVQARQQYLSNEIDGHQLEQGLEDLGWHPAAVSVALDDLKAQQLMDSADD
tara:strand:+ start:905 stop:1084 length:180 start_codon:yes stop_codon:yes gene_type:complete